MALTKANRKLGQTRHFLKMCRRSHCLVLDTPGLGLGARHLAAVGTRVDYQKGSQQIGILKIIVVGIGGQGRVQGNFEHDVNVSQWSDIGKPGFV